MATTSTFIRVAVVISAATALSGCVTFFGPSMKDFGDTDTAWPATAADTAKKAAADALASTTKAKFNDWGLEYARVNRGAAGLLSALGVAGAVAAGYDASKDVLKGIGFGVGGVVTFEEFMSTKNGADIIKQGHDAVECAISIADGKLSLKTGLLRNAATITLDASTSMATMEGFLSGETAAKFTTLTKQQLMTLARYEALSGIARDQATRLVRDLRAASAALDAAADMGAVAHELWMTVKDIRSEVVAALKKDAVDLAAVFGSVQASINKVKDEILAKLTQAKQAANSQNPEIPQKAADMLPQIYQFSALDNQSFPDLMSSFTIASVTTGLDITKQSIDLKTLAASAAGAAETAIDTEAGKLEQIIKKCEKPAG
jgi:hypothetical protein